MDFGNRRMLSYDTYPPFREDQMRVKEEDETWPVLTSWGHRGFFESRGYSWAFDGSLKLPPRDTAADYSAHVASNSAE